MPVCPMKLAFEMIPYCIAVSPSQRLLSHVRLFSNVLLQQVRCPGGNGQRHRERETTALKFRGDEHCSVYLVQKFIGPFESKQSRRCQSRSITPCWWF